MIGVNLGRGHASREQERLFLNRQVHQGQSQRGTKTPRRLLDDEAEATSVGDDLFMVRMLVQDEVRGDRQRPA